MTTEVHPAARYFVIEGMDGSGKTTQHKLFCDRLEKKGYEVVRTKEPTEVGVGKTIHEEYLSGKKQTTPIQLTQMFYQDRDDNLRKVIEPALTEGNIVVSDRNFYSTVGYQSTQMLSREGVMSVHRKFKPRVPDKTVVVDIDADEAMQRIANRKGTREIFEKESFLRRLHSNYKILPRIFPTHDIEFIDGIGPIEDVNKRVWGAFISKLPPLVPRSIDATPDVTRL